MKWRVMIFLQCRHSTASRKIGIMADKTTTVWVNKASTDHESMKPPILSAKQWGNSIMHQLYSYLHSCLCVVVAFSEYLHLFECDIMTVTTSRWKHNQKSKRKKEGHLRNQSTQILLNLWSIQQVKSSKVQRTFYLFLQPGYDHIFYSFERHCLLHTSKWISNKQRWTVWTACYTFSPHCSVVHKKLQQV